MFAKKLKSDNKGSAAIEFAFVVPFFLAIIFAIMWMGWSAMKMNSVHYALVKAGRAVQLNPALTQAQVQTIVGNKVTELSGDPGVTVSVSTAAPLNGSTLTTLTANYPLSITVPLVGSYSFTYSTSVTVAIAAS